VGEPTPRLVSDIDRLAPEDWRRMAAGLGLYLSYEWIRSVQASALSHVEYLVVAVDGVDVGVLPLYLKAEENNPLYDLGAYAGTRASGAAWYPALLAGTRTAYLNRLIIDPTVDPDTRRAVARVMIDGAVAYAARRALRTVAFSHLDRAGVDLLHDCGFAAQVFATACDMVIDLDGLDHDGYLATFTAHRRARLRAERRRFERSGYEIAWEPLADVAAEAGPLVAALSRSHGSTMTDERGVRYLADLAANFPDRSMAAMARVGPGEAIACVVALVDEDGMYLRTYGRREGAPLTDSEYFVVCYDAPLRLATSRGARFLHLGCSAYRPKVLRGATAFALWTAVLPVPPHTLPSTPEDAAAQRERWLGDWADRYGCGLPEGIPGVPLAAGR
jgi:predicted N-acyltransferase